MSNLLFSQGGISDSTGLRGGQISHKLTGQYEPLILNYGDNINVKNKIIIVIKLMWNNFDLLTHLKNNGNKLVFDVVDLTDKDKFNPNENKGVPNFLPDIRNDFFDGYIVNNNRQKKWWRDNVDGDESKPIFVIPNHWDMRFEWFPKGHYDEEPYFYFLGTDASEGNKNQNCLHLSELQKNGYLNDWRKGGPPGVCRIFLDSPINGCQLSIRKNNSWEYCMKPATKLSTSAAMDSVLITTNDWTIRDLLSEPYPNYPYLLETSDYDEVVEMINKVKKTFGKEEWVLAKKIINKVKDDLSIDSVIKNYIEVDRYFS